MAAEPTHFTSISRFIEHVGDGEAHTQLSKELVELAGVLQKHVKDTNQKAKGKITITLSFDADPKGVVTASCKSKIEQPRPGAASSVLWINSKGGFTPDNPKQQRLPLAGVHDERPRMTAIEPIDEEGDEDADRTH